MTKQLPQKYWLKPKNHMKRWTDLESELLVTMAVKGHRLPHMADVLERREGACSTELHRMVDCKPQLMVNGNIRFIVDKHMKLLDTVGRKNHHHIPSPRCRHRR